MDLTAPLIIGLIVLVLAHGRLTYRDPVVRPAARRAGARAGTSVASAARRARRHLVAKLALIGLAIGAAWGVTFWRLVTRGDAVTVLGINDYPLHLQTAQDLSIVPFRLDVPEFLFHLLAKTGILVAGPRLGPVLALVVLTATAYVGVVLLFLERSRTGLQLTDRQATVAGLAYFFMETPVLVLLYLGVVSPTAPFATVHWWGNPTFLAALPFTFLCLPLIERVIEAAPADDAAWRASRARVALDVVVILGALAKPAFTLVLIPAVPTYALLVRGLRGRSLARVVGWAVAPVTLVILWQVWYLRTGQSTTQVFRTGLTFDPIVEPIFGWGQLVPVFVFPALLLLLAIWASGGRFVRERSVQLVLVATAFAVPLMLTLRETGSKSGEGNMFVPFQACVAVLVVLAVRSVAWEGFGAWRNWRTEGRRPPAWSYVAALATVALLAGGILSVLAGSGVIHVPANWELQFQGT